MNEFVDCDLGSGASSFASLARECVLDDCVPNAIDDVEQIWYLQAPNPNCGMRCEGKKIARMHNLTNPRGPLVGHYLGEVLKGFYLACDVNGNKKRIN